MVRDRETDKFKGKLNYEIVSFLHYKSFYD